MSEVWKPHVTVAAVIEDRGRYLLVEEEADGRIVYNQPAGHLEPSESLPSAAIREVREETAHEFRPEALVGVYRWTHPGNGTTFLRFTFSGPSLAHHPDEALDDGIRRAVWLDRHELERLDAEGRLRSPLVCRCIDDHRSGARYPLALLRDLSAPMP